MIWYTNTLGALGKWNNRLLIKHIDATIFYFVRDGPSDDDSDSASFKDRSSRSLVSSSKWYKTLCNFFGCCWILGRVYFWLPYDFWEKYNWVCRPLLIQCPYGLRSTKNSFTKKRFWLTWRSFQSQTSRSIPREATEKKIYRFI